MPKHIRMIRRFRRAQAQAGRRVRGSGARTAFRHLFPPTHPGRRELALFGAIYSFYDGARWIFRDRFPVAGRLAVPSRAAS